MLDDGGADATSLCDDATAAGRPCDDDDDCGGASVCEKPRCDTSVGVCIVTDGPPDGFPCENDGRCSGRVCCRYQ